MYLLQPGEVCVCDRCRASVKRRAPRSALVSQENGCFSWGYRTMGKATCLPDMQNKNICRKAMSLTGKSHAKHLGLPPASQSSVVVSVYLSHPLSLPWAATILSLLYPGTH